MYNFIKNYVLLLMVCFITSTAFATSFDVRGVIIDDDNKLPVPFASVIIEGSQQGAMSNENGEFFLSIPQKQRLIISCLGYYTDTLSTENLSDIINIFNLKPIPYKIEEVVISAQKDKYKKKDNPAIAFMKKVKQHNDKLDPNQEEIYHYERYEKLTYGLNQMEQKKDSWLLRKLDFLEQHIDTNEITQEPILTVSTKEALDQLVQTQTPDRLWRTRIALHSEGIDEILPEENLNNFFDQAFQEIDIFQPHINLFFIQFVSPLSSQGPNFYKYYLLDTLQINNQEYIELGFVPFVSESFGFTGTLRVRNDSTYLVEQVNMNVPAKINLNYVKQLYISQSYELSPEGYRVKTKDDLCVDFQVFKKMQGIYGRRIHTYKDYTFAPPTDTTLWDRPQKDLTLVGAPYQDKNFWKKHRHMPISKKEDSVSELMVKLREIPLFFYTEKLFSILVAGYFPTDGDMNKSKFNIGPINTLISWGDFEGARFRLGGMTTPQFSNRWFFNGYLAYGTGDEKLKYQAALQYSFIDKKDHPSEFPIRAIEASYLYDVDQLGQQYEFTNKDNIVLAIKRKPNLQNTYLRKAQVSYKYEAYNGLTVQASVRNMIEYASKQVQFNTASMPNQAINHFMMTEAEVRLRYAPGEKFYQLGHRRLALAPEAPVFSLAHITAKKGFLGSDFNLNRTEIAFQKRFLLSSLGYLNTYIKGTMIWDAVPFPILALPNANLSYIIQPRAYSLMNPLEFISDRSIAWDVTYFMNGWLFNRAPLLKHLQWREVIGTKGYWGRLSNKNNPAFNRNVYNFPTSAGIMTGSPYWEMSAGIENIFKLLRIEYVWRLNYRNQPHVDKQGVRLSMHLSF